MYTYKLHTRYPKTTNAERHNVRGARKTAVTTVSEYFVQIWAKRITVFKN